MTHISFSELKNWQKCAYYHKLVHINKLKAFKGNEYTAFGSAIHSVCEQRCTGADDSFKDEEHFDEVFKSILKDLEPEVELNISLVRSMRSQARNIIPHIMASLKDNFGDYEIISVEERLMEEIEDYISEEYSFKGFIDLVLKTKDGKYHIIDWKTCSWGWNAQRRSDPMTIYQLTFYKHYYAYKHKIDPENIETHFALLKRTAKDDNIEMFRVSNGKKRTENALKLLKEALYNITNEKHVKNRLACHGPFGPCEFYKTKHCP